MQQNCMQQNNIHHHTETLAQACKHSRQRTHQHPPPLAPETASAGHNSADARSAV